MGKVIIGIKIFLSALLLITIINHYANAESLEKVVSMGFDNPKNDYAWSIGTATLLDVPVRKSNQSENMRRSRMNFGSSTKVGCEVWKMIP